METGFQMMLSKSTTFTDVCMARWQLLPRSFNFQHSPLIFGIFTNCASLFQFVVFSFAKLAIKFSISYDNA